MATPQQQARTLTEQMLAVERRKLETARAEEARLAQQRSNAAQQAYGAAAEAAQPLAGQVQNVYAGAAGRIGGLAAILPAEVRANIEAAAAASNKLLAQNNAPTQIDSQAAAAGNYIGLGGFIPAASLEREGAAFTSAAAQLPSTLRGVGVQSGLSFLRQGEEAQRPYSQQIRDLEAKRPELLQSLLSDFRTQERNDRVAKVNEAATASLIGQRKFDQALKKANFELATEKLNLSKQDKTFNQALKRAQLELDQAQYDLAVQREKRLRQSPKKGGFSPSQKRDMQAEAFATAQADFQGFYVDGGETVEVDKRNPVETLRDLIGSGVPFSIAIKAIQRFARAAEAPPEWKATLKWTRR